MNDPLGRAYLENQAIGHGYIEFSNWPTSYDNFNLALVKTEWRGLRLKYFKLMKLGDEVIKLLEEEYYGRNTE